MKRIIIILIFCCVLSSVAKAKYWGSTQITAQTIPASLSNYPGTTNILIHKLRMRNTGDATNDFAYPTNKAYPHIYEIQFLNLGTLPSSNIKRLRLWWDYDGTWNGNERECNTNYFCQTNVRFERNFSPTSFGSSSDIAYFGPDLNIFFQPNVNYYFYLMADLSTNILDNRSLDCETVHYGVFVHAGDDWYFYSRVTNLINSPYMITTETKATNLHIEDEPTLVNINQGFSLTVRAKDRYGNIDEDYVNSVYFTATNVPPTPYTPPVAFISNTNLNPYTFTGGDAGSHIFSSNCFKFYYPGVFKLRVTDGILNDDWSEEISAAPAIHHFDILDDKDQSLSSFSITAGKSFSNSGITNVKVSAKNYVGSLVGDYTGILYFLLESPSSLYTNHIPYDNNPATPPTTAAIDKFEILNNGFTNINGNNFIIYNAGNNKLTVFDTFGFKGEVNLVIVPDVPVKFNAQMDSSILAGSPFQLYIALSDKWNNTVPLNHKVKIEVFKDGKGFTKHTFPEQIQLSSGIKYFTAEENLKILESGTVTVKLTDLDDTSIVSEHTIQVDISAKKELSILQNYITPGETKEVPIYYNNTYEENI
ncbi:MAG: hypothetical protein JW827_12885, partial [Spirochaetes bacterium]|nr:hypothetical protein [Spirochaetota bacterium]